MESEQCNFSDVKLNYFPVNGKAGIIRAILSYKKIPFVDNKISFEDWPKVKHSGDFEFEQLPMLECCGRKIVQSEAIILTLAKQLDLLGSDANLEHLHLSLLFSLADFYPLLRPALLPLSEAERDNLEANKAAFLQRIPFFLGAYENRLKKYGGKYAVGDILTLSDIILTVFLHNIFRHPLRKDEFEPVLLQHAPSVAKLMDQVSQNELADFFANYFMTQVPF